MLTLKQKATVLQLHINPHVTRLERPMESESNVRVIDLEPIHTQRSNRAECFFIRWYSWLFDVPVPFAPAVAEMFAATGGFCGGDHSCKDWLLAGLKCG